MKVENTITLTKYTEEDEEDIDECFYEGDAEHVAILPIAYPCKRGHQQVHNIAQ
jgi:hypothetical protein